jgi:hypothetical protein
MTTLINTKITINKPVKNKCFGYSIIVDKKEANKLLIKAKSANGRGRGIVGVIEKNGTFVVYKEHKSKLLPLLNNKEISRKIDIVLDLTFGSQRTKTCKVQQHGLVQFLGVK